MNNKMSKNDALIAKAKDWLIRNTPSFIEVMESIRKERPEVWERLYSEMVEIGHESSVA